MFIQKWMESKYLKIIPSFLSVQAEILMSLVTTSLSKFPVWHIDGTTIVKSIWFLDSTKLQTLSVKISWQTDV